MLYVQNPFALSSKYACSSFSNAAVTEKQTEGEFVFWSHAGNSKQAIRCSASRISHFPFTIEIFSRSIAVTDSWFKLHIVDRVLKIGKCLLCYVSHYFQSTAINWLNTLQEYMRPVQLLYCVSPHCKATYCTVCVLENFGKCYACQVWLKISELQWNVHAQTEAGLVDSTRSQLIPTNLVSEQT